MPIDSQDRSATWVELADPAEPGQRFRCDLTWLTSSWTCIFGNGCQGIYADRPDDGCCTLGAHFTDADDVNRVSAVAGQLGEDEWQYHSVGRDGAWQEDEDGEARTRVVDGACIFLNRPGFPAGPGCALHQHALAEGLAPHTTKPDVCWQLPLRRSYRTVELADESSYLEVTIGEYDRRGWGPGGHDLDWYCSANSEAHVGREPLYRSNAAELRELMGEAAYEELVPHCEAHLLAVRASRSEHPDARGRRLLPLLVHPATLAARAEHRPTRTSRAEPATPPGATGAVRSAP